MQELQSQTDTVTTRNGQDGTHADEMDKHTCLRKAGDRSLNKEAAPSKEWVKDNVHEEWRKISDEDGGLKTPEGDAQSEITRGRFSTVSGKGMGHKKLGFSSLILSHQAPELVQSYTGAPLTLPMEN